MFGPVQRLRICGSMFPCFVSEEEHAMRVADLLLQSVPIRWYRKVKVSPYSEGGSTLLSATNDLLSGVCGKVEDDQIPKPVRKPGTVPTVTQFVPIEATLNVVDTNKGPALMIVSNNYAFVDDDAERTTNASLNMSTTILFKNMLFATAGAKSEWKAIGIPPDDAFVVFSKKTDSKDAARVLTCQLLPDSKLSLSRDEALRHLNILISWDKTGPIKGIAPKNVDTDVDTDQVDPEKKPLSEALVASSGRALVTTSEGCVLVNTSDRYLIQTEQNITEGRELIEVD